MSGSPLSPFSFTGVVSFCSQQQREDELRGECRVMALDLRIADRDARVDNLLQRLVDWGKVPGVVYVVVDQEATDLRLVLGHGTPPEHVHLLGVRLVHVAGIRRGPEHLELHG